MICIIIFPFRLQQMRDAAEKRKELEKEHAETLASLREKQNELQWKCSNISEKVKLREFIESLQVGYNNFLYKNIVENAELFNIYLFLIGGIDRHHVRLFTFPTSM